MAEYLDVDRSTYHEYSFEVGSSFYAKATHLIDPHNFYVLPSMFENLMMDVSVPGAQYKAEELKVDTMVVYFSHAVNNHVRGIIKAVNYENKCRIHAIDNGFLERDVSVERIFHLGHKYAGITTPLVQFCELDMCMPVRAVFAQDAVDAFKFFIGNERLNIIVKGKNKRGKLRVTVFNSNPDDIASLLAITQYTVLGPYNMNDFQSPIVYDWKHQELEVGETLNVRVQHGGSLSGFYVCTLADYNDYVKTRADFTQYCRSLPKIDPEDFVRGKAVGVMEIYGEPYERATIIDVIETSKRARVKLIDWGREFVTDMDKVKAINMDTFTRAPARALYVSAPNATPWDNGLPTFLHKGFTLVITITRVGREFDIPHRVTLVPPEQK